MLKYVIALYIRLSVEDSKTESFSIHNQQLSLNKYASAMPEADNAEIIEFIDNGYSGTNFERPAIQELLELVRCHKVDCIIVKDFSRFGRNAIETGYFIERVFPLFKTRFISINDDFDTNNYVGDTGGMEVAFKYMISEYYSKDLSEKSKSAKYIKMRNGEYQSKLCLYGYKKGGNNRLEIDEEAATVVRLIFDLSAQGNSAQQIAKELYRRGIPTPGEYKADKGIGSYDVSRCHHMWQRSSVLRILSDERYIGTYIMGKRAVREVGGNRVRLKDESEWFKIPDHHPAIVDKEVFARVQAGIKHFPSQKKNHRQYILRGKVFCGCCNHAMYRMKKDPEFSCRFTSIDENFPCRGLAVKERELEGVLYEIIRKQAAIILNVDDNGDFNLLSVKLAEQSRYEKQIQDFYDMKRRLYEQYVLKEIDFAAYSEQNAAFDGRLADIERVHSDIAATTTQMLMSGEEKSKLRKLAGDATTESTLTQALADALIDKVYIFPDNQIEIAWKIQDFAGNMMYGRESNAG